jgi:hypothetical protein
MKRDDDQELWDLLGHSPAPKPSPFFARNVLREIRRPRGWAALGEWFHLPRLAPAAIGVALALVAAFFLRTQTPVTPADDQQKDLVAVVEPQDYDVIADLDDLLDPDDSWDDEESAIL